MDGQTDKLTNHQNEWDHLFIYGLNYMSNNSENQFCVFGSRRLDYTSKNVLPSNILDSSSQRKLTSAGNHTRKKKP